MLAHSFFTDDKIFYGYGVYTNVNPVPVCRHTRRNSSRSELTISESMS